MADETYDLPLVQGETFERTFAWRQPDDSYANLHLWDIRSQVRQKEYSKSTLLIELSDYMTVVDGDPDDGKFIQLTLPGEVTAALEPKLFKIAAWDLFLVLKTDLNRKERLLQGAVTMDPAATDLSEAP